MVLTNNVLVSAHPFSMPLIQFGREAVYTLDRLCMLSFQLVLATEYSQPKSHYYFLSVEVSREHNSQPS